MFFEHRGLLEGRSERRVHDAGASSFLYPFLDERERELEPVVEDVRRSVLIKARDVAALRSTDADRERLRAGGRGRRPARQLRRGRKAARARQRRLGHRCDGCRRRFPGRAGAPAIDLTEDPAILTAIANDIGTDAIFSRQVIAYGATGDALLALSTSGAPRT